MRFSYHWLKELSRTEKSSQDLAELLMARAFEVEEVIKYEHNLEGVVVGEVLSVVSHPNADRLKVTEVSTGDEVRKIVCGAPNVAVGQKVAVALPGAKLPNGAAIKEAEVRGVKSSGMICALDELGLGSDHKGIWAFPEEAEVGIPLAAALGLDDWTLEVKILPNRGMDALSHYGLAREICALEGRNFPAEKIFAKVLPEGVGSRYCDVSLEADTACKAYVGMSFALPEKSRGLSLAMIGRMIVLGHHPIHPAADIANYLMLLFGQPMHAFDAAKLSGRNIIVRFAREGESLVTLDDRTITLSTEDLVIADAEKPVALAGIIGGKDTAVSPSTRMVFFEIANFDSKTIRRSRVRHGFATDAAYYFEHSVDLSWPEKLRGEVASFFSKYIDASYTGIAQQLPVAEKKRTFSFPFSHIKGLLGVAIPEQEVLSILHSLMLEANISDGELRVAIPSFRPDLEKEADIIEEVGRVYGYEHIVPSAPVLPMVVANRNPKKVFERDLKEYLTHRGWDEIMTYSFYGEEMARQGGVPEDAHLVLENPMNPDQKYLRAKLLPTVLGKAIENMSRTESVRIFEFGSVYLVEEGMVKEEKHLAFAYAMKEQNAGDAFLGLKGELERLAGFFRAEFLFEATTEAFPLFHPGRTAFLSIDGANVGVIGEAHPSFVRKFGARKIAIAEFSLPILRSLSRRPIVMEPIPKFPSVLRDISLVVPDDIPVADLLAVVRNAGKPLLRRAEIFDVYRKGKERNVAFHLMFGMDDRTITGKESEQALENIRRAAKEKIGSRNLL